MSYAHLPTATDSAYTCAYASAYSLRYDGGMTRRSASRAEWALETRLRRAAARQHLTLHRSRQRDPRGAEYGTYEVRGSDGEVLTRCSDGRRFGWTLAEVEGYLSAGTHGVATKTIPPTINLEN